MSMPDRYTTLIPVSALMRCQQGGQRLSVFDCRTNPADSSAGLRAYEKGHIPGSHFADLDRHLAGPVTRHSGRHPLPDRDAFCEWLRIQGVSTDSLVVTYDAKGGVFAARLWWMLRWVGHEQVAVLDGGLDAWLNAGGGLEKALPPRPKKGSIKCQPALGGVASTEQVLAVVERGGTARLVDARASERYQGIREPLDPVAGHIPGAVNYHCLENLDLDGRFLQRGALQAKLASIIGTESDLVISYCGSGVTACHNLLALEHIGVHGALLYPGSWSEWIQDPQRPIKTGKAP